MPLLGFAVLIAVLQGIDITITSGSYKYCAIFT
jgi:hypothetical protein